MQKIFQLLLRYKSTIGYIVCVYLVNALILIMPAATLFHQEFSLGDFTVGAIYVMRDLAQREIKHYVIIAMLIGGVLSYIFSNKDIAVASITAFMTGELIDFAIYTYTKKPLSQRIFMSSMISCPIDSFIFLKMAHQPILAGMTAMLIAKTAGVTAIWYLWRVRDKKLLALKMKNANNVLIDSTRKLSDG